MIQKGYPFQHVSFPDYAQYRTQTESICTSSSLHRVRLWLFLADNRKQKTLLERYFLKEIWTNGQNSFNACTICLVGEIIVIVYHSDNLYKVLRKQVQCLKNTITAFGLPKVQMKQIKLMGMLLVFSFSLLLLCFQKHSLQLIAYNVKFDETFSCVI